MRLVKLKAINQYECRMTIKSTEPAEILSTLENAKQETKKLLSKSHSSSTIPESTSIEQIIQWNQSCEKEEDNTIFVHFQLPKKIFGQFSQASFLQKELFVKLVGLRDNITKQPEFRGIVEFYHFQNFLKGRGVKCKLLEAKAIKRIHLVHPEYVAHDDEVGEGIRVTENKHPEDNAVYVGCEDTFQIALEKCEMGSTLIIDGHWEHKCKCMHGIWDACDAEDLANNLVTLLHQFPGKISRINLWGCESGVLKRNLDKVLRTERLFVKCRDNDKFPDMKDFRKRVLYVSEEENPFHEKSLAHEIWSRLEDKSISISAVPSLGYPYPPDSPCINIASDASDWKEPHFWWTVEELSKLYTFCRTTKAVKYQTFFPEDMSKYECYHNIQDA